MTTANNDDEDIVVVDGEFDLDRQDSQTSGEEMNDEIYDDDDDVEYGQSRMGSMQTVVPGAPSASEQQAIASRARADLDEENSVEIGILEKFKYQESIIAIIY